MTRLSLYDRKGDKSERKLPMCRICCRLFASDDDPAMRDADRRIAAFRPCGHVFHYACIMDRYQKMEDNCNCVTCYARFEDLPVILYMEWSKSARPISNEEQAEIQSASAPGEQAQLLYENLDSLKIKFTYLQKKKEDLIRKLNETTENIAAAKARCDGLDQICAMLSERIEASRKNAEKAQRACDELEARLKRDRNQAVIGEICELLLNQQQEAKLSELIYKRLAESADPDDLLSRIGGLYEHYHKQVRENTKTLTQLRTTMHSMKKDIEDTEARLAAAQRAKQASTKAANPVSQKKPVPPVVDRKIVPTKPKTLHSRMDDEDLGMSKRAKPTYNFFNL